MNTVLAIDIGGTKYSLAIVDTYGRIQARLDKQTNQDGGATWMVDQILAAANSLRGEDEFAIAAIGVGFGGPVDFKNQQILASLHVAGWPNTPLAAILAREFGVPCRIDNDANTGALGEARYGSGRDYTHFLYYTVSTGIGGGIIINGELWRGAHNQAGELGHVLVLHDGPTCSCGLHGCLESLCSGPAIAKRARAKALRSRHGILYAMLESGRDLTAKDVFAAAAAGCFVAQEIVDETKDLLAAGIATTVNVLDPEAVIIGGGVSLAGDLLFNDLAKRVNARLVLPGRRQIDVRPSALGVDSVLLGAAALAWDASGC